MKRLNALKTLSLLTLALMSSASHAEYLKYEFTAHGTSADFFGAPASAFPTTGAGEFLQVGTAITGYFYYDLATPLTDTNANGNAPSFTDYYNADKVGIKFSTTNGFKFTPNGTDLYYQSAIHVDDAGPGSPSAVDEVRVTGLENTVHGAAQDVTLSLQDKHGANTLTSSALPLSLSLNDFNGTLNFYWTDNNGGRSFIFNATLDSLTQVAAVPEPATYAMLLAGLALVGVAGRRKQRQGQAAA